MFRSPEGFSQNKPVFPFPPIMRACNIKSMIDSWLLNQFLFLNILFNDRSMRFILFFYPSKSLHDQYKNKKKMEKRTWQLLYGNRDHQMYKLYWKPVYYMRPIFFSVPRVCVRACVHTYVRAFKRRRCLWCGFSVVMRRSVW